MAAEAIKALLAGKVKDNVNVDELTAQLAALHFAPAADAPGGLYCVVITHMPGKDGHPPRPVTFEYKDNNSDYHIDSDFVLIKFGRADTFTKRASNFAFHYEQVFLFNFDNNAEATVKKAVPANFKDAFFRGSVVSTVKSWMYLPESSGPAPTEWRVVSQDALTELKRRVAEDELTISNYETQLKEVFMEQEWAIAKGNLKIVVDGKTRKNMEPFKVYHFIKNEI